MTAQAEAEVLPAVTESNGGYSTLLDRALTAGAPSEVWDKLLTLQERWEQMQARKVFDEHLARAKAELPLIVKDKQIDYASAKGGRVRYIHETLPALVETVTPILSKYGLATRWIVSNDLALNTITVICVLWGHGYRENAAELTARPDETGSKNDIQGMGSAQTYLQRYTLKAALGLAAAEDDDSQATSDAADPKLTEEQTARLEKLIKETKTNKALFLKWARVSAVPDIRQSYYESCVETLEMKRKK